VWPEKGDAIDQRLIDYLKDTVINRDGLDNISTGWCALALFTIGQAKEEKDIIVEKNQKINFNKKLKKNNYLI
jgi:hypothetical protein